MAIQKITYDNKVAINVDSTIPDINKCNASDLNQIKSVVNNNADETPTQVSDLPNDAGYITKDVDDLTNYTKTSDLSSVATSGDYDDLLNKPTIPSISDEYGTSTTNGYSQNYLNENTLNPNGNATTTQSNVSSATITNTLEAPLEIDLKGNTSQTGTPTPSSPIPINVVSGDNQIVVSDGDTGTTYNIDLPVENLYQLPNNETKNGITFTKNNDGTFNLSGTATAQTSFILYVDYNETNIKDGKTYTFSANKSLTSGVSVRTEVYNNTTWVRAISNELSSTAQTTTGTANLTGGNKIRYSIWVSNGTQVNITNCGIQLEEGSKANTYTPYGTTPIELNKIGTYQDYIYKENDKWYLHKEIGKYIYNNDLGENGIVGDIVGLLTPALNIKANISDDGLYENAYCNLLPSKRINGTGLQGTTAAKKIRIATKGYGNDYATIRALLVGLIIYYELETPTNTEITYTPLIEQLNTLEEAQSKEGTTNINQVNNDAPFILDITAFIDTYDGRYESLDSQIQNNKNDINNLEKNVNYSTNEQVIGKWIDGKPIYRKVIECGTLPNNNAIAISSGLTASETRIINISGVARDETSGYCIPIPHINTNGLGSGIQLEFNANAYVYIRTQANYSSLTGYVIIEYTKTTD